MRASQGIAVALAAVGLASAWFGYSMVEDFRSTTGVWVPCAVEIWADGAPVGTYPDGAATRGLLDLAPGHGAVLSFPVARTGEPHPHLWVMRHELGSGAAPTAMALPVTTAAEAPAAGPWAELRGAEVRVVLPGAWLNAVGEGVRVIAAASRVPLNEALVLSWAGRLPAIEGEDKGAVRWTRAEFRVDPRLATAAAALAPLPTRPVAAGSAALPAGGDWCAPYLPILREIASECPPPRILPPG